jgi:hypothetical protein
MAGVPVDGTPIVLTGAGLGLTITPVVGSRVVPDSWKATCAARADQTPNGKNAIQAAAALQPVITAGINGKVGYLFDGVNDFLRSTVHTLLTAFPFQTIITARFTSTAGGQALIGTDGFCGPTIYTSALNTLQGYNGTAGLSINPFTSVAPTRFSLLATNSLSDTLLAGAQSRTGVNSGSALPSATSTHVDLGRVEVLGLFGAVEIFDCIITPPTSLAAFDAALNSAAMYGPGGFAV